MFYMYTYQSPLGEMTMASNGNALTGLWFDGQQRYGSSFGKDHFSAELPIFDQISRWLDIYFDGREPDFTPPLQLAGSDFRKSVWEVLLTIPYGKTMTYGEIAKIIASQKGVKHMSAQAIGGAVGHNPVSIIVPCHRVIGANGSLTGYAGGLDRKRKLLCLESLSERKVLAE